MTDKDQDKYIDPHTGVETTDHSWDGIRELNNPLPRWWLIVWYISIVWAVIYMVLMPALPGLPFTGQTNTTGLRGHSDRILVAKAVAELDDGRKVQGEALLNASLEEIRTDRNLQQFALAMGESQFGDNCATCHGSGGRGANGYPSLADDIWLWDGTLDGIERTIRHGIRHQPDLETRFSAMPRFGRDELLSNAEIDDVVEHVLSLSGKDHDLDAADRGAVTFGNICASCHGAGGTGDRTQGAPNLTDNEWLFGGAPYEIRNSVYNARNAHMPGWEGRLDDATIKALSVYVHSLGGGE